MKRFFAVFATLSTLALGGCIDSARPILTDAKPVLGERLHLQFYGLRKGYAHDPETADYVWKDGHYTHAAGGMKDVTGFTVHPFEGGDYIVQTRPNGSNDKIEYALLHPFVDGVYYAAVIDEDDANEAVRTAHCKKVKRSSCRVETREQLFALARATAARPRDRGGLAIRLPNTK